VFDVAIDDTAGEFDAPCTAAIHTPDCSSVALLNENEPDVHVRVNVVSRIVELYVSDRTFVQPDGVDGSAGDGAAVACTATSTSPVVAPDGFDTENDVADVTSDADDTDRTEAATTAPNQTAQNGQGKVRQRSATGRSSTSTGSASRR
jgi:hypothetical protein